MRCPRCKNVAPCKKLDLTTIAYVCHICICEGIVTYVAKKGGSHDHERTL
jgi:hypothetical protein